MQAYLEMIANERHWSWALIALAYFLVGLFVRGWFLNDLYAASKALRKDMHKKHKSHYLRRSFIGWILFFIPMGLLAFYQMIAACRSTLVNIPWYSKYLPIMGIG